MLEKPSLIMKEIDLIPVNYSCDKCFKTFHKGNDFLSHLDTHRTRFCKICLKEVHLDEFMKHAKSHASGKCDYCGLICKNKPALKYHIFKEHVDSKTMCEVCGTVSDNETKHNLHMTRTHTGKASFVCDICGAKLFTSASLRKHHMMKHVKEKQFVCNICNKAFVREYALQSHMITHSDVVLFVCEVCGKGFKLRHNLRMHQENIHDLHEEGSFQCVVCKKTFLTYLALGIHMRVHSK